jgi:hypothetical protein
MGERENKPKSESQASDGAARKKPYRAPRLTVYGDLRTITKAKGGSANDGGSNPKTKI